ncbi:uncharacterized protein TNCV_4690111 [Trichonephila clavipes]|nr:uncharacterized protein TNCV_4690111 [Trichonephila clavipes]
MMKAGWSASQVGRQLGHSDCVISRHEFHHIVRNARVHPFASSVAIQVHVVPLLGAPVSSRTIRRYLAEGHWDRSAHYALYAPMDASTWSGAAHEGIKLQRNGTRSSLATNPDSISGVMTIVFLCGAHVVNA